MYDRSPVFFAAEMQSEITFKIQCEPFADIRNGIRGTFVIRAVIQCLQPVLFYAAAVVPDVYDDFLPPSADPHNDAAVYIHLLKPVDNGVFHERLE